MSNFGRSVCASACVLILGLSGCGADYQRRLEERAKTFGQETEFSELTEVVDLPDSPLVVRLPPGFQRLPDSADPKRWGLPSTEATGLPNQKATYEASIVDGAGGKQHYYIYLCVADLSTLNPKDPMKFVELRLPQLFPNHNLKADRVSTKTMEGRGVEWDRLRVTAKQPFCYTQANGQDMMAEMDGILEVWGRSDPASNRYVMIGWRVPAALAGKDYADLDARGPLVAGSVGPKT